MGLMPTTATRSLVALTIAGCLTIPTAVDGQTRYGDWFFAQRVSGDRDASYAGTLAYDGNGSVGVVCTDNVPLIAFTHRRLNGDDDGRVQARFHFDHDEPSPWYSWHLSPDHESTQLSPEQLGRFLGRMAVDTTLSIQIVDPGTGDEVDLEIPLFGFADAVAKLPCMPETMTAVNAENVDLSEAPVYTPMTVRPQLVNNREVMRALERFYPPLLRDSGVGATINVWFFIDETGTVQDVKINEPSRYEAFNEAALEVARIMKFSPAFKDDEVIPVWVALDITFEVQR